MEFKLPRRSVIKLKHENWGKELLFEQSLPK